MKLKVIYQKPKFLILMLALCTEMFLGSGCTVGPDYTQPELELPDTWQYVSPQGAVTNSRDLTDWWTFFQDAELESLIKTAGQNNPDLKIAFQGIEESRALRDSVAGATSPKVDLAGSYMRTKESANGFSQGFSSNPMHLYSAGFDAGWEIDLFGRFRRAVESSQATLQASIMNYHHVLITLYAEIARNYVELRTIQKRIDVAGQNLQIQRETLTLTENRFKSGLVPELDVVQARQNLHNTESELPSLYLAQSQTINRLAVLTGQFPQSFNQPFADGGAVPQPPGQLAIVLPADLLRQRPDIQQAERQYAAQLAQVGVTTSELYPSLTLSGSFHYDATTFSGLGYNSSRAYSFGPSFRWNLLDGNRIRNRIRAEQARTEQVRSAYEKTVLQAFEEVDNAFAAIQQQTERLNRLMDSVAAARSAIELVQTQYKSGLVDFQNVLDTQRTLFQQEDKLTVSQGQVVLNWISLYKALGGGWLPKQIDTN